MISVIIVTYNSEDVIEDCLDSLIASKGEALCLLIFDNSSTDKTIETIRRWSIVRDFNVQELTVQSLTYQVPGHALIKSDVNIGFAGGVNRALNLAIKDEKSDLFWILNP